MISFQTFPELRAKMREVVKNEGHILNHPRFGVPVFYWNRHYFGDQILWVLLVRMTLWISWDEHSSHHALYVLFRSVQQFRSSEFGCLTSDQCNCSADIIQWHWWVQNDETWRTNIQLLAASYWCENQVIAGFWKPQKNRCRDAELCRHAKCPVVVSQTEGSLESRELNNILRRAADWCICTCWLVVWNMTFMSFHIYWEW